MQEENLVTMVIFLPAEMHVYCMHSKFSKNLYRCMLHWMDKKVLRPASC